MNKPTISVILPTFNRANEVSNAINSVLGQTFKGLELIIINDASTDDTRQIIRAHQKKDSRIIIVENKNNYGCSESRNIGLSYAQSGIIAFMDDDDRYTGNQTLKCLHSQMESEGCDLVIADYNVNEELRRMNKFAGNFKYNIIRRPGPFLQCILIKKKIITKMTVAFDKEATPSEDWDFFITLSKLNPVVAYCACNSFKWRLNQDSQSINLIKEAKALTYICCKHYKYMLKNIGRKTMSNHYRRIARIYEKTNSTIQIHQFYKKAFTQYPLSIKNIFYRTMVIMNYKNMKPLINFIRQLRRVPNA